MPVTVRLLAAAASGVLLSAALPPSQSWFLLAGLPVLFGLIAGTRGPRAAFWTGAAGGVGFFTLYVLWLPASFASFLGPAFWLLFPLLVAALAAIWGATAALSRLLGRTGTGTLAVLAPAWIGVEMLRAIGFIGFPWGTVGYAWLDTPVAQLADVVGVHGLGLLTTVLAALLAAPFVPRGGGEGLGSGYQPRRRRRVGVWWAPPLAAVLLALAWWGGDRNGARFEASLPDPSRTALLVQGNLDPFGRAVSGEQEVDVHTDLTVAGVEGLAQPPDLVVWPEGAVLGFPLEGFRGEPAREAIQASAPQSSFVVGGRAAVEGGTTNSVFALANGELRDRYDKHVLVPFGERWPLLGVAAPFYRAVFGLFGLPMLQNTVPGPGAEPLGTAGGDVAAYVCYESVFPRIAQRMVAGGAEVLVNVTNDAWFARGSGARQHFDMGRMRAIETRRWLLRAGNDGITGSVDPLGRVRRELARGTRGTLLVRYEPLSASTAYVRWGHLSPWLVGALVVVAALAATAQRRE